MAEETTRDFLERRRREIANRLESSWATLNLLQEEFGQIERALKALDAPGDRSATYALPSYDLSGLSSLAAGISAYPTNQGLSSYMPLGGGPGIATYSEPSIRDLILSAFRSPRFIREGGTNAEIREFIRDTSGRDIERTSLSPALSRLRDDGILMSDINGKWKIIL